MTDFTNDIEQCVKVLANGGIILYPTDTIWGISCDATNETAVNKIFNLKQRTETKSMIILLQNVNNISNYAAQPESEILNYVSTVSSPTTVVYEGAKNVAKNLINADGTIAIRVAGDEFCIELINKFNGGIVSTSANISGKASPNNFSEISEEIKNGVDYIVQHRQGDFKVARPSTIIKMDHERKITVLRS